MTTLTGLLGPARRVTAMTGTAIPERVVDGEHDAGRDRGQLPDHCSTSATPASATVTTGFYDAGSTADPAVELYGGTGTIQMIGDDWAPEGLRAVAELIVVPGRPIVSRIRTGRGPTGCATWSTASGQDREPLIPPEHAYHVLEIMLKAIESARDGRTLPIDSTFTPPTFDTGTEAADAHLVHDPSH